MAISSFTVALSTTPTLVVTAPVQTDIIVSAENAVSIYYCNVNVTVANGFVVFSGASFNITLHPGESLYAVLASGTASLNVLTQTLTEPTLTVLNGSLPVAATSLPLPTGAATDASL